MVFTTVFENYYFVVKVACSIMKPTMDAKIISGSASLPDDYPALQESLSRTMWKALEKNGPNLALVEIETGRRATYADLLSEASRVASRLLSVGCQSQDVVAIFSSNSITWIVVYLAVCRIGAVPAAINPLLTAGELRRQLETCEAKYVFTIPAFIGTALEATKHLREFKKILLSGANHPGCVDLAADATCSVTGARIDLPPLPPLESLPGQGPDDPACIMFSSGTTGVQKAVLLTNSNLQHEYSICLDPKSGGMAKDGQLLSFAPFSHVAGGGSALFCLAAGLPNFLLLRFDPDKFLHALDEQKFANIVIVPPIAVMMAKSPLGLKYKLDSLRCLTIGTAPLSSDVEEMLMERYPRICVRQIYGLTETCGVCSITPDHDDDTYKRKPGSVGRPTKYVSMKVIDIKTGEPLGAGHNGEICIKSPLVIPKYVNNPQATAETIDRDGWLHSGDIGYYDEDGYFYVVDRLKELIKYKGYQVPPVELENVLLSHPEVADAGVIGLPDAEAGELPLAWVVRKPNSTVTEAEIQQFVDGKVAAFKRLRGGVQFVDAIPKTPSGKILRRKMKEVTLEKSDNRPA